MIKSLTLNISDDCINWMKSVSGWGKDRCVDEVIRIIVNSGSPDTLVWSSVHKNFGDLDNIEEGDSTLTELPDDIVPPSVYL